MANYDHELLESTGVDFGLKNPFFESQSLTMKESVFCSNIYANRSGYITNLKHLFTKVTKVLEVKRLRFWFPEYFFATAVLFV